MIMCLTVSQFREVREFLKTTWCVQMIYGNLINKIFDVKQVIHKHVVFFL